MLGSTATAQTFADAQRLSRNEQYEDADSVYNVLIAKNVKKIEFYYYAGMNLILKGDSAGAARMFDEGLVKGPENPFVMIGKGHMALRAGNISAAEQFFAKAAVAKKKMKPIVYKEIGRAYLMVDYGTREQLLAHAKKALEYLAQTPETEIEALTLRGDALAVVNPQDLSEAVIKYTIAKNLSTTDPRPVMQEGRAYYKIGNYQMSNAKADDALAMDKEFAPAYRLKAESFARLKQRDSAIFYFEEYLKRNNNLTARRFYVVTLFQTRDWNKTIEQAIVLIGQKDMPYIRGIMSFAIAEKPDADTTLIKEGVYQFTNFENNYVKPMGRSLTASESYYKAILYARMGGEDRIQSSFTIIAPVLADTAKASDRMYQKMQDLYLGMKEYELAYQVINFKRVKQKDMLNNKDMYFAAICLTKMERYSDAIGMYEQIIKADTNYVEGYYRLATAWGAFDKKDSTGNVTKSFLRWISKLDSAQMATPKTKTDMVNAYKNMAQFALYKKDYEKAIYFWGKVLEIKPEDTQVAEVKKKYEDFFAKLKKRNAAGSSSSTPAAGGGATTAAPTSTK